LYWLRFHGSTPRAGGRRGRRLAEFLPTNYSIYANRHAQGSGWDAAAQLLESDDAGSAFNPGVGADSNGNAIALWCQYDGVHFDVQQNRYGASAVSHGNGAIDPEGGPAVAGAQ
jgi:hypothetical protein